MYTVAVIDGRANGLPILYSPALLADCSGQHQSLGQSRERQGLSRLFQAQSAAGTNSRLPREVFVVNLQ